MALANSILQEFDTNAANAVARGGPMRRPRYFLNSILGVVVAASECHEQPAFPMHVVAF